MFLLGRRKQLGIFLLFFTQIGPLNSISEPIHQFCLKRSLMVPRLEAIVPTLVCGKKPRRQDFIYHLFVHLGLIHILVISGAHLGYIKKWLRWLMPASLFLGILFLYVLMTGAQPPVVRAFILYLISSMPTTSQNQKPSIICLSVFATLLFTFTNEPGISLALSWVAITTVFWLQHPIKVVLGLYVTMMPLLMFLSIPHPLTVLVQIVVAPLMFFIMMPAALLSWSFPFLEPVVHLLWTVIGSALMLIHQNIPPPTQGLSGIVPTWALVYSAGLHGIYWYSYTRKRRKLCASPCLSSRQ